MTKGVELNGGFVFVLPEKIGGTTFSVNNVHRAVTQLANTDLGLNLWGDVIRLTVEGPNEDDRIVEVIWDEGRVEILGY
jgi:hypothetical protein